MSVYIHFFDPNTALETEKLATRFIVNAAVKLLRKDEG